MVFRRLRVVGAKKKLLGALVIIAFIAFFTMVFTRYIVVSEINWLMVALVSVLVIGILLLLIESRKKNKRKTVRRSRRRSARKRRR